MLLYHYHVIHGDNTDMHIVINYNSILPC